MSNFFIIHGAEGHPEENWFPWLKNKLEKKGYRGFIPKFPTPDNQDLESWLKVIKNYQNKFDKNTIVIAHSLGVLFALHLLEKHPFESAFFVAGFSSLPGNRFDEGMKSFAKDFNWEKIRDNCKKFTIFHSLTDPYVKVEKAEELQEKLSAELIIVKNAGHFNANAGYKKFDLLLERLDSPNC